MLPHHRLRPEDRDVGDPKPKLALGSRLSTPGRQGPFPWGHGIVTSMEAPEQACGDPPLQGRSGKLVGTPASRATWMRKARAPERPETAAGDSEDRGCLCLFPSYLQRGEKEDAAGVAQGRCVISKVWRQNDDNDYTKRTGWNQTAPHQGVPMRSGFYLWCRSLVWGRGGGGRQGEHQPHQADDALNPILPPPHTVASSQSLTYPPCVSLILTSHVPFAKHLRGHRGPMDGP